MTTSAEAVTTRDGMTAGRAIDRIEKAHPPLPGDRRLHARGAVYDAHYEPTDAVRALTSARSLSTSSEVIVRFSNGGPRDADDRTRGVRGMSVAFSDAGTVVHNLTAANFQVFPSRNPEGFIDLVEILGEAGIRGSVAKRVRGGVEAVGSLARLLRRHPESRAGLKSFATGAVPASFATCRYDGLHAFFFDGETPRAFRYRLVPQLGEVGIGDIGGLDRHFLIDDLDRRIQAGPVTFTVVLQLAEPGDPTDDPSKAWPATRVLIPAGTIRVVGHSTDEERWQRHVFDPNVLPEGISASDDPVLAFRAPAYSVSAERRLG